MRTVAMRRRRRQRQGGGLFLPSRHCAPQDEAPSAPSTSRFNLDAMEEKKKAPAVQVGAGE